MVAVGLATDLFEQSIGDEGIVLGYWEDGTVWKTSDYDGDKYSSKVRTEGFW